MLSQSNVTGWLQCSTVLLWMSVFLNLLGHVFADEPSRPAQDLKLESGQRAGTIDQSPSKIEFRNRILPILTKSGCNTGKCHGSASGKDGFRLSLFGYDPTGDHYRITKEVPGRRINPANPDDCLLINKAIGKVSHTGGERIKFGSAHYREVVTWIAAGAPADTEEVRKPIGIEVTPSQVTFRSPEESSELAVVAKYDDGSRQDVTDLTVFLSNNEAVATVDELGAVTSTGAGGAFVLARFDQFTEGASIVVRPGRPFVFPDATPVNYIDELIYQQLDNMHIAPSERCTDEIFLRRVTLDLTGRLPTAQEFASFIQSTDSSKRNELIDRLIDSRDFADLWIMKWAEMLQIRTANGVSPKGLALYDRWLRDRFHSGKTIDKIVADLIPASGGTFENPATTYYQTETTPQLLAENLAQSFLGTRIQCAQCHNHPFDRWTMDDYYGFASFFARVGYKQAKDPREITIFNLPSGSLKHPLGDRDVPPRYLGGESASVSEDTDPRQLLAHWLTNNNIAFANHLGNVVWSHLFGIGIVDPVDDLRVSNPPSNPQLFATLGKKLLEHKFDIRPLVRDICRSNTYQLSTKTNSWNALDERNFSRAIVRRLRAEVLLDCINQVTEADDRLPGLLPGARAIELADGRTPNYFLTTFGRATRETACACEVKTSPTLSQALHLLNGETTSGKIEQGQLIDRLLAQRASPDEIAADLYRRCLTREPTASEAAKIRNRLKNGSDVREELIDLFWAILNSNEFIFNH